MSSTQQEEALDAPVWDENAPSPSVINELSNTFAKLDQEERSEINAEEQIHDEQQENDDNFYDKDFATDKNTWNAKYDSIFNTESALNQKGVLLENGSDERDQNILQTSKLTTENNKESLLNSLAPEEDPLNYLSKRTVVPTDKDNLFENNDNILPVDPITTSHDLKSAERNSSLPPVSNNKPKKLFSGKQLRRRHSSAKNGNEKMFKVPSQNVFTDPLAKLASESEFVDEPLDDVYIGKSLKQKKSNDASSIFDQMHEPLFSKTRTSISSITSPQQQQREREKGDADNNEEQEEEEEEEEEEKQKGEDATSQGQEQSVVESEQPIKHFEISVKNPTKVGDITNSHIEYTVETKLPSSPNTIVSVKRRYNDFRWLYRQLQNNHWGHIIPPPPDKQMIVRFNNDFIEGRRLQMNKMLDKIANNSQLQKDEDFFQFLTFVGDKFSNYAKKRDHISFSHASNDSNDLAEISLSELVLLGPEDGAKFYKESGGSEIESYLKKKCKGGSFLGFSSAPVPKYVETDEFFAQETESLKNLEDQLKNIYKSLELVNEQRKDLANVTEEFSKSMQQLIELNVTSKLTNVFKNFSDVQLQIKSSLCRSSQMEELILASTLEEYLRVVYSCRAILNQRHKLGSILVFFEHLINESKNSLSRSKPDKIAKQQEELSLLQKRYSLTQAHWKSVGKLIRKEMSNFDKSRIEEFRNSIEIYLESAIETQKEVIEIWETFYQNSL
ncbi:sorting nexin 1 SCDLUD_003142 [Saccharomycodes ludwigii]|nr:hypothetical protein SCDLUD_003142 [Saccharomycodes ludwigii]KAH3900172.1 hypothetical protein SCDLUD_003142 [Saccharomycodes ludwigii]